jgi:hypothetical protein
MPWKQWMLALLLTSLVAGFGTLTAVEPDPVALDEQTLKDAKVATDGPDLLTFLKKRCVSEKDLERLKKLIRELGDDSFETRQNASAKLVEAGAIAVPLLREAIKDPDIEIRRRAESCLSRIEKTLVNAAVVAAAVRVLASKKPAGVAEGLLEYIPFADDDTVAEEVRIALAAVCVRDGKADPAIVAALEDKSAPRRGAAGAALARSGLAAHKKAVKKLLQDKVAGVRLHVALALARAKEKDAVPVLIELLAVLPPEQIGPAEEFLYQVAADKPPEAVTGADEETRRKYRDAWAAWWKENADKVDLDKISEARPVLGYTMVVMLDTGKLLELDSAKKVRWEIRDLAFPLDAQYLPGGRVLVAEQGAGRVTERDLKGKILWEKKIDEPLMAQRLRNGLTVIATRTMLVEVDRAGKTVSTYRPPNGESIMRAQKLDRGELALVLTTGINSRYVRLDAARKEIEGWPVQVNTSGGRIDVLPNGNVLVPEMTNNRVIEYSNRGKILWQKKVDQPIAAVRLANGNTLVTLMNQRMAIELDKDGKQVWEYANTDSRVSRAWRR